MKRWRVAVRAAPGRLALAFGTCAITAGGLAAQDAVLRGVVRDTASGRVISGATVSVRGTLLSAATSDKGNFILLHVPAGRWTVRATAIGYAADSLLAVTLAPGEVKELELSLRPSTVELQEIVVTASRMAEDRADATTSISTMPIAEIVKRNVTAIDGALVFVPGITMNGPDQMDIRGSSGFARGVGSRVLMLVDGHPALSADGGEIDFNSLPLLDLDRVEVVKGAYSAVYGSNALGGVVNLITTPVSEQPATVVRAHFTAWDVQGRYAWNDGMLSAQGVGLQHSRPVGAVGVRGFVGYEGSDGFTENGQARRWMARVKAGSQPGALHAWDAYAIYSHQRSQSFFTWNSSGDPYRVPEDQRGDEAVDQVLLSGATVTPVAQAGTLLRLSPYLNWNASANDFQQNQDEHSAIKPGMIAQLSLFTSDRNTLTVGADGAWTRVTSNFLGAPTVVDAAMFLQDEFRATTRLNLEAGLRADYRKASTAESEFALSPKLGASVRISPAVTLRASVGAGYRAPSAIEQFVNTQQYGFQVIPNPALRGEHAWSAELGAHAVAWDRIRLDAAVFGSLYSDLIGPAPAPGQALVFQFQNVSRARVAGLDLGASAPVIRGYLDLALTFLYLDTENRDTGEPLPYRSRYNLTGTLTGLQGLANVDVRYRSRVEEVLAYPLDPRGDITVIDVRVNYRAVGILWQLKVSNLLNTFYTDVQERRPGQPRAFEIAAVYGL